MNAYENNRQYKNDTEVEKGTISIISHDACNRTNAEFN